MLPTKINWNTSDCSGAAETVARGRPLHSRAKESSSISPTSRRASDGVRPCRQCLPSRRSGQNPQARPATTVTVNELVPLYFRDHVAHHCRDAAADLPKGGREWVLPSPTSATGHVQDPHHLYARISKAGSAKFWFHGLHNSFITIAERELMLPPSLTKRLVNHARPNDVAQDYAADWTIAQLREPAQRIANRIEALMCPVPSSVDASA